jgi:hypothetical protein
MKLTGGEKASGREGVEVRELGATPAQERSFKNKLLSTVESTLAPVVGVQLGKTANDSGQVTTATGGVATGQPMESTTSMGPGAGSRPSTETLPQSGWFGSSGTAAPPASPGDDEVGAQADRDAGGNAGVTPVEPEAEVPSPMSSPTSPAPDDSAASIDQLTKPQTNLVPDALQQEPGQLKPKPFPKLGGTEPSS